MKLLGLLQKYKGKVVIRNLFMFHYVQRIIMPMQYVIRYVCKIHFRTRSSLLGNMLCVMFTCGIVSFTPHVQTASLSVICIILLFFVSKCCLLFSRIYKYKYCWPSTNLIQVSRLYVIENKWIQSVLSVVVMKMDSDYSGMIFLISFSRLCCFLILSLHQ